MRFDRDADPIVPDLVAPGISILSCIPDGEYAEMHGTSQAAPHITGLAALLMQASPSATADQVEQAILDSCVRPPGMLPERGNRGIPSGSKALALLTKAV
jgi:subtilisin family serine protease